jgi:hypothetical protein
MLVWKDCNAVQYFDSGEGVLLPDTHRIRHSKPASTASLPRVHPCFPIRTVRTSVGSSISMAGWTLTMRVRPTKSSSCRAPIFGRAYLSDGWAARFMQSLLTRFQIAFVGYAADDPPVQYLLEALNLHAGNRSRLFAFQPGSNVDDAALWEHRGVRAIPFDNRQGFDPLWDSYAAGAERARCRQLVREPACRRRSRPGGG